jgi:hypothetical protein
MITELLIGTNVRGVLLHEVDHKEYPHAGLKVDGLEVTDNVPNTSSISASLYDYKILKGIRKVPVKDFETSDPHDFFYSSSDFKQFRALMDQIKMSGWVDPLIVVIDNEGPYVLEGVHRFVALAQLKKKYVPALVVLDIESLEGEEG